MFVVALIIFTSCSPAVRPYYETPIGKKKQDYYNKIQYGQKNHPKMKFWERRTLAFQLSWVNKLPLSACGEGTGVRGPARLFTQILPRSHRAVHCKSGCAQSNTLRAFRCHPWPVQRFASPMPYAAHLYPNQISIKLFLKTSYNGMSDASFLEVSCVYLEAMGTKWRDQYFTLKN